jgi:hypothetical protein
MTRREALALFVAGLAGVGSTAGCGPHAPANAEGAAASAWTLDPLVGLAPAAGLVWLVDAHLAELFAVPALAAAMELVVPAARFDAFAERHGGIDLRRVTELVLADYDGSTLALARTDVEPARVEAAFAARAIAVEGRAIEGGITRFWGSIGRTREQVAVFGSRAVGLERGRFGPLRAAMYFALGKLKRAQPALAVDPLARAAALLGDAHVPPVRAFAPGPFAGEWAAGLGGLLAATTAIAASATPAAAPGRTSAPGPMSALALRLVLTGAWGADAAAAAARLASSYQLLANDSLGRLLGMDHPLEEPQVSGDAEALRLAVLLDAPALFRGLHAATEARIGEIMTY